jgi:hypothetical protein
VQRLKGRLSTKAAKTVNNILTVLNVLLKKAVDWDVLDRMPCAITLLPVPKTSMSFYDFDEYERLVAAASAIDATAHLIVLLDGEAGLRCGEMIAGTSRSLSRTAQISPDEAVPARRPVLSLTYSPKLMRIPLP